MSNLKNKNYDAVVVGAGHAGCEAALALARTGIKTVMLTLSLDSIGFLACNPSIGGTAKGQIVGEIDALGGAKVVHHIVPLAILLDVILERGVQIVGLGEIEFYEINAWVGEKLERSGGTHSCPSLIAAAERLCHYKTAYKASRSGYQYLFCHFLFCNNCY